MSEPEVMRIFRTFNAASEAFLRESERHEPAAAQERREGQVEP
jgi:sulfhydrogenase subunit delta